VGSGSTRLSPLSAVRSPTMLQITQLGHVTRLRMFTWRSKLAGLDVSAYVLRGVMIDTGFPRAWPDLEHALSELRLRGAIVTHGHEDHAGNAPYLAARAVPLHLAPLTERTLRARPEILPYRRIIWGRPPVLDALVIPFATSPLEFIPTPGHSDDHHIVWDAETETVFSGDLWLGVRSRAMHHHEDPRRIIESLERVAALRPKHLFDAHRGEIGTPREAIQAKIAFMKDAIGAIERRIAEGWSDRAILNAVLGGEERAGYVSAGEYARINFVRAVRCYSSADG
jgi:glyoxylase-like metal-dependent hydrolase (beta-lactamase superfamily II)